MATAQDQPEERGEKKGERQKGRGVGGESNRGERAGWERESARERDRGREGETNLQ